MDFISYAALDGATTRLSCTTRRRINVMPLAYDVSWACMTCTPLTTGAEEWPP